MNDSLNSPRNLLFSLIFFSQLIQKANTTALPTDSIAAYYPLSDTLDYSGHAYHGTTVGQFTTATDRFGRLNSAYHFDGNSYIFGGCNGFPTGERTISIWINPDRLATANNQGMVCFSYGGSWCGASFLLNLNIPTIGPRNVLEVQGHCYAHRLSYVNAPNPVGKWQHWVITTSASGKTSMYINGIFVKGSQDYMSDTFVQNKLFTIGASVHPDGSSAPYIDGNVAGWQGLLDDVIVYNRALNNAEVYELYKNEPPKLNNNLFSITENTSFTVTPEMLSATDISPEQQSNLQFIIDNVKNGRFELQNSPGNAITTFTQQQIESSAVRFVPNGSQRTPTFNIKVSDGLLWTESVAANITFNTLTLPPTEQPSRTPIVSPSSKPTGQPTSSPSDKPSQTPSAQASSASSALQTFLPSPGPTHQATNIPTYSPTLFSTYRPSQYFSSQPTAQPTPSSLDNNNNYYLIIIAALAGMLICGGLGALFYCCFMLERQRNRRVQNDNQAGVVVNNNIHQP